MQPVGFRFSLFPDLHRHAIGLGVCAIHAGGLALMALGLSSEPDMIGGAPVIQVTLAPRASFDGANAPQTSAANPTLAPENTTQPRLTSKLPLLLPAEADTSPLLIIHPTPSETEGSTQGDAAAPGKASQASEAGLTEGGGALVLGAATASNTDIYEAAVLAWIERHKRHPGGLAGIVTVSFTLDRRGAVRASKIIDSSGIDRIDNAALSQLRNAAPFPRPSPMPQWRTRDFAVRIDFRSSRPHE